MLFVLGISGDSSVMMWCCMCVLNGGLISGWNVMCRKLCNEVVVKVLSLLVGGVIIVLCSGEVVVGSGCDKWYVDMLVKCVIYW